MRPIEPRCLKVGLVAAVAAAALPGHLMAAACNAFINGNTASDAEYILNEPIGIELQIGAGLVEDDFQNTGYLDISKFEYQLDCEAGTTYPDCTPAGNTVVFDAGSVQTTCTDENAQPITFTATEADGVVTFTPAAPSTVIRNNSETFCEVTFNVTVTALSDTNLTKDVIELTGWANLEETVGQCDNGLVASAASSVAIPFASSTRFLVTKDFSDDSTMPVDVHIQCNSGLPLTQSAKISETSHVNFTVIQFVPGELACRVWEDPVPDGYTEGYTAGLTASGEGIATSAADGCYFSDVVQGGFTCEVANTAGPGTYTVNKEWILGETDEADIDLLASVNILCDGPILETDAVGGDGTWTVTRDLVGANDSVTVTIDSSMGAVQCQAFELPLPDSVMVDNGCAELQPVASGEEVSCLITNTLFFEGIPTLGQYGKALLVLLVLGVGMVGFRRFV